MHENDVPSALNHSDHLTLPDEDPPPHPLFDPCEGGFLQFLPPPPRPLFLEDMIQDEVTACDLCTWAMQEKPIMTFRSRVFAGELGWALTLVIVSLSSALIGAVIMVVVTRCKRRLKNVGLNETECGISLHHQHLSTRPPITIPANKEFSPVVAPNLSTISGSTANTNVVWSWLARRNHNTTNNLNTSPSSHAMENHYTHMEEQYNVEEVVYDELDKEGSEGKVEDISSIQVYHNSAFNGTPIELPISSAPSSAYYSDLSVIQERPYETVDNLTVSKACNKNLEVQRSKINLGSIGENVNCSIISNYV
ncbi:uncharacterized protein [Euwallacea fornicatus]|uniref:uncharacterized protein isoform X1 n=2 Tax=Euwallacea fornicatus TaxID=995702 RepID=UPI00338EAC3C